MEIAIVYGLLLLVIVLLATERFSVDLITLLLLIALVATRILTPEEAFSGFSNDVIFLLISIFVLTGALQETGTADAIGSRLSRLAAGSPGRLLVVLMAGVGALSSFMNNTTATALFVSPTLRMARQLKVSASKFLMPVAYASILGGTCTLIGTSTNVAVSGFITRVGLEPLGLFETTKVGVVLLALGVAYIFLVGRRLLPDHRDESLTEDYAIREYLSEIIVVPGSHLIGQEIFTSDLSKLNFRILGVLRGKAMLFPTARTRVAEGDVLLVEGRIENLLKVKEAAGIEIRPDLKLGDRDLETDEVKLAEALVAPRSELIGRTLRESSFRQRYGVTALAIYRQGQSLRERISDIPLELGDLLLIQGPRDRLELLRRHRDLWVLEEVPPAPTPASRRRSLYTVLLFAGAILAGMSGWLPLSVAFLAAAVLAVALRCIKAEDAYRFVEWRLVIMIAGMTSFGLAMQKTGAAEFAAQWIVSTLEPLGVTGILAGLFVLTIILTQPLSNAAAALVVLPIALQTARELGVNERTFAVAIMLAASVSFVAPFEPSCILVYGPGKYRFVDFVRVGIGLTILLTVAVLILVPLLWPLHPVPSPR